MSILQLLHETGTAGSRTHELSIASAVPLPLQHHASHVNYPSINGQSLATSPQEFVQHPDG